MASIFCDSHKFNFYHDQIMRKGSYFSVYSFMKRNELRFGGVFQFNGEYDDYMYGNRIFTEEGLCATYNTFETHIILNENVTDRNFVLGYQDETSFPEPLEPRYWSLDGGYTLNTLSNYPRRSFKSGISKALNIAVALLTLNQVDTVCRETTKNIRITFHHPTGKIIL